MKKTVTLGGKEITEDKFTTRIKPYLSLFFRRSIENDTQSRTHVREPEFFSLLVYQDRY